MANSFRSNSVEFNKSMDKDIRSKNGIYFTPKPVRDLLYTELNKRCTNHPMKILEPAFGSGEFLFDLIEKYPSSHITGVEKHTELFTNVVSWVTPESKTKCTLRCMDFLDFSSSDKYDLIVGNPPYFVIKSPKHDIKSYAKQCSHGRLNIYVLFLYKCLEYHLEDCGFLAFILPTSLYNSGYYQSMRDYIFKYTTIHFLSDLQKPGFHDTNQSTMVMILQKSKTHNDFIYKSLSNEVFISPYYEKLQELTNQQCCTLHSLGLGAKIGNVVWNQIKDKLTDDQSQTLLIYPCNIKNSEFKLFHSGENKNVLKKQYIITKLLNKDTLSGPVILLTRGYGNKVCFDSVLIENNNFYAENHIIVIYR